MLRLVFERTLATDAATAWTLVTDPVAMNTWSSARIEPIARGDGDHAGGVGALRRVRLPRGGALTEIIEREAAPTRLEYRVIAGAPVRSHRGTLELDARGATTQLRWTVEIEPITRALTPIIRGLLEHELARSLDRLVQIAPASRAAPLPPRRDDLDRTADLATLRRDGLAIAAGQGDLADDLAGRDDPRAPFARIYHHVTTAIVDAVGVGRFDHPAWIYRLLPVFDRYFTAAIAAPTGAAEPHWERAFAHVARVQARRATRFELAMHAVYAGMRAHIEDDLPRTLARVWIDHYGPRAGRAAACDPARFRADYLRMRDVFQHAADALMAELPRREWTTRARVIDTLTPAALRGGLIDRYFYPITRERARAFERGTLIARLVATDATRP